MTSAGTGTLVLPQGIRPAAITLAAVQRQQEGKSAPVVVVTASGRRADRLVSALGSWIDGAEVFPSWETLPHERLSPQVDTMARRAAVLRRLENPVPEVSGAGPISILAVPIRAFMQPTIAGLGQIEPVMLEEGSFADRDELVARLTALGYEPVDLVERRGQVAVRGSIVDVFVPTNPHPLRIEFFGDEVDEVRWFNLSDQRALGVADQGLWAPPARELLLSKKTRERALAAQGQFPAVAELLELASEGIYAPGLESLSPLLVDSMVPLIDLLPKDALFIIDEPEQTRARSEDLIATAEEFLNAAWGSAADSGKAPIDIRRGSFIPLDDLWERGASRAWWEFSSFPPPELAEAQTQLLDEGSATEPSDAAGSPSPALVVSRGLAQVGAREVRPYREDFSRAASDLRELIQEDWELVVAVSAQGAGRRIAQVLGESDVAARLVEAVPEGKSSPVVAVVPASAGAGFVMTEQRLAVLTEQDLTGRAGPSTRDMRKMPSKRRARIDPLTLQAGDYVVHEQHGVGKFIEMTTRTTTSPSGGEVQRDYLVIEYLPSRKGQAADRLYVPTSSLDQISRYSGSDVPRLSRMGGADWAKTKQKARAAVREIAAELVRLYAARTATAGYAFSPDTPWQRELEDAFEFVETPDQLATVDEVKADMERPVPMDRLLTGDVGYGKTEIAVRAAFKAVQDGKQVAILVPTTLLAQQHHETFSERYAGFPIRVATLSRFSSKKEADEVKEGLRNGTVDVVIGTHTLLTGAVEFKDLGLVVVDEEQRFGVEHKETLKALRTDVDVLSMSATPIPRTLEMAVAGIREMSVLQTPPEERQPVLTYVGAYQDQQVAAAIRRELLREGQVFYVHNRVESINRVAAHVQELVPEARVRVAHGKLSEAELERVILDFWNHEFDVLVSTTIIETGLDISNANTLIVDRADAFGLSQLHQLRGRVGRGRERAYAYFFYQPDKTLSETALERLRTIASNTDLGSGLAVAQKDLEIRGAGNLLGGAQSGHIEGVGFDLYIRMVSEAVAAFRGDKVQDKVDVRVELAVDAHLPEDYVSGERLRLETYGRIAAVTSPEQEAELRSELSDRFGPIPDEVDLLLELARLRERLRESGIEELITQGNYVRIAPIQLKESQAMRLQRLFPGAVVKPAVRQVLVPLSRSRRMGEQAPTDRALLKWVNDLLDGALSLNPSASESGARSQDSATVSSPSSPPARRAVERTPHQQKQESDDEPESIEDFQSRAAKRRAPRPPRVEVTDDRPPRRKLT
ncbi:MAG: transcription-repair coupling factor [Scrofimicrobium sp.]